MKRRMSTWSLLGNRNKTVENESCNYTNCDWCFGTVTQKTLKGLEDLEIRGPVETIQTTKLLRTARILRIVLEIWGTCCHLNSNERASANYDVKNSIEVNNNKRTEKKKLWNMKVTVIPIVIGSFSTVTKKRHREWRSLKLEDEWRLSKLQHCWDLPG